MNERKLTAVIWFAFFSSWIILIKKFRVALRCLINLLRATRTQKKTICFALFIPQSGKLMKKFGKIMKKNPGKNDSHQKKKTNKFKINTEIFISPRYIYSTAPESQKKFNGIRPYIMHNGTQLLLIRLKSLSCILFNKLFLVQCFTNKSPHFRRAYSFNTEIERELQLAFVIIVIVVDTLTHGLRMLVCMLFAV